MRLTSNLRLNKHEASFSTVIATRADFAGQKTELSTKKCQALQIYPYLVNQML